MLFSPYEPQQRPGCRCHRSTRWSCHPRGSARSVKTERGMKGVGRKDLQAWCFSISRSCNETHLQGDLEGHNLDRGAGSAGSAGSEGNLLGDERLGELHGDGGPVFQLKVDAFWLVKASRIGILNDIRCTGAAGDAKMESMEKAFKQGVARPPSDRFARWMDTFVNHLTKLTLN